MASKRKQSPRKAPDEWRAINRSAKVKDGRSVILAVPDPRHPGKFIVGEAYWHTGARSWWWANTAPKLPGCDAIADVLGDPTMWRPMPAPPVHHEAPKASITKATKVPKTKVPTVVVAASRKSGAAGHARV